MLGKADDGVVVRVSRKGQATIPKPLRDRFGISTPGRVVFYEEDGKLVVEPLPTIEETQGLHAGRYEPGEVLDYLERMKEADKLMEQDPSSVRE